MQCCFYEFCYKCCISVVVVSKIFVNFVYSYKGMGLSMGIMCVGVMFEEGFVLYYVDSDGMCLVGNLFCVGSGQIFVYGVLDVEYNYDLSVEDVLELGCCSIFVVMYRDVYFGGFINLYYVKEEGWVKYGFNDMNFIFWKMKLEKGEFINVMSELEQVNRGGQKV